MIVQIYEIQTPKEASTCIEVGVDHLGSVLLSKDEWKNQGIKDISDLTKNSGVKHSIIPLFNDMDIIFKMIDFYMPDIVHFCEDIPFTDKGMDRLISYQQLLKHRYPEVKIIRTIPFPTPGMRINYSPLEISKRFEAVSDYFLADTKQKKDQVRGYIGISGKVCNWNMVKELVNYSGIPVIIAGGLSPENVFDALIITRAHGADSCSGTNVVDRNGSTVRFKKDFNRVKRFVQEVRRAGSYLNSSALELK